METKKKITKLDVEREIELDPTSDRYRICPLPRCRKPHMVSNRGRDYCCDEHADEHYNMIRKYIKLNYNNTTNKTIDVSIASHQTAQPIPNCKPDQEWQTAFEKNMTILNELNLDPKKGTKFNIDFLVGLGFNFFVHSSRVVLHNIDSKYNTCHLILGDFLIYFSERNTVLIYCKTIKKYNLCTFQK